MTDSMQKEKTGTRNESTVVEETLSKPQVHDGWEDSYRTPENEAFYELAFNEIAKIVGGTGSTFLDVGCGSGAHAMRLADRGYFVSATDFSEPVVENAQRNVDAAGYSDRIQVAREDILNLSFGDGEFDNVLCWGVLMHIPEVDRALSELSRAVRKGGKMVISEGNAYSLQSTSLRFARRLLGKSSARVNWTPAGVENWEQTETGELMTRQSNIGWLQESLRQRGFTIRARLPGQATELYTRFSMRPMRSSLHWLNRFWFRHLRLAGPAFGNIIIAEKVQ